MQVKSIIRLLLTALAATVTLLWFSPTYANEGMAFPEECQDCHGDNPKYQLKGARMQYEESGHALGYDKEGVHSWYANGGGCQQCHTNEGFIEYTKLGKIESEYIEWPSQPGCFSCHAPHETGDFSLRKADPVTLVTDVTVDVGKGNLCINCHQARRGPEGNVIETAAADVSGHFGPHYGTQSNLFVGSGAYEFPGMAYTNSEHRIEVEDSCVDCHMALPEGRYRSTPALGGHSFFIAEKEHNGDVTLSTASCEGCHAGIKQVRGTGFFNVPAGDDYDGDGTVEPAQAEVKGLLALMVNDEGTGILQSGTNPMFDAAGDWNAIRDPEVIRSQDEMAALFNYKFFKSDRSYGVHNMTYAVQVLMDTIGAMDPSFDVTYRPE